MNGQDELLMLKKRRTHDTVFNTDLTSMERGIVRDFMLGTRSMKPIRSATSISSTAL